MPIFTRFTLMILSSLKTSQMITEGLMDADLGPGDAPLAALIESVMAQIYTAIQDLEPSVDSRAIRARETLIRGMKEFNEKYGGMEVARLESKRAFVSAPNAAVLNLSQGFCRDDFVPGEDFGLGEVFINLAKANILKEWLPNLYIQARRAIETEDRLANVLRRLGFREGLTWRSMVRAMRGAGFSIDEIESLPIVHVIEILEAKANAFDCLRDPERGREWTAPSLLKSALMAGGRPVETAGRIDGGKLRELRGDTPQPVFARLCGISVDTLRRAERGKASPTTIKKIERYRNLKRSTGPDIKLKKTEKK